MRFSKGGWLIGGLLVLGAGGWWLSGFLDGPSLPDPPSPDTTVFEPPVARVLVEAREQVLREPASARTWGHYGMVLDVHELIVEAAQCYEVAERLDPADFRWPYMRALCLPDADPRLVIKVFERACHLRPDYAPTWLRLGEHHLDLGESEPAASCFQEALARAPGSSHALLGLARLALARKEVERARTLLEEAARSHPGHREVHALLAQVYAQLGLDDHKAVAEDRALGLTGRTTIPDPARREVLALGQGTGHWLAQANGLLAARRPDLAESLIRRVLAVRPDDLAARRDLARALFAQGKFEAARQVVEEILSRDPGYLPALRMKALSLVDDGDGAAAQILYRAVLGRAPTDQESRTCLARLLLKDGKVDEALGLLRRVVQEAPHHREGLACLAWTLATGERLPERDRVEALSLARRLCTDYLEPAPRDLDVLAAALAASGLFPEAVQTLERAIEAARTAGDAAFTREAAARLEAYRAGRSWRLK